MTKAACQLYILRHLDEPLNRTLERVAEGGFDGVEFAYRVDEESPEPIVQTLESTGLGIAGGHVKISDLEDEFDETVARYRAIGCDRIVIPWLDEEHFESIESIENIAGVLERLADRLSEHGIELSYHNHRHEFVELDGKSALERLIDATDERIGIQLDIGIATAAGSDPVKILQSLDGRVPTIHFRDFGEVEEFKSKLGEGDVDLNACVDAAEAAGVEWLVYEGDHERDTLEGAAIAMDSMIS